MASQIKERAGLFGGTFDPVHLGHLRAAEEIRENLSLDKVYFIPAAVAPHKKTTHSTPSRHRLEMLKLAVSDNPSFEVCDYELGKDTPSYTIETLRHLKKTNPESEYYFMVGNELFREIDTWKEWRDLFKLSNFVVITRPGYPDPDVGKLPLALENDFSYYNKEGNVIFYKDKNSSLIAFSRIMGLEVSSTEIRRCVKSGRSIKYLVPAPVEEYILRNGIYATEGAR
ncbi:MAG TPA: nicotinate-nucleotide adenylyltransferase [Thermodesulfobacteriota bacterium]|nr:nicotinate-nucleotide adenylyltransferase [Thermodesulfobacteriota bacterium]